jgi:hypothetical protein
VVRLSALRAGRPLAPGRFLVVIFVIGWVDSRDIVRLEGLGKLKKKKNPMSSSGIESAPFRLVAYCLNQLRYRVPLSKKYSAKNKREDLLKRFNFLIHASKWAGIMRTCKPIFYVGILRDIFKIFSESVYQIKVNFHWSNSPVKGFNFQQTFVRSLEVVTVTPFCRLAYSPRHYIKQRQTTVVTW